MAALVQAASVGGLLRFDLDRFEVPQHGCVGAANSRVDTVYADEPVAYFPASSLFRPATNKAAHDRAHRHQEARSRSRHRQL